MARRHHIWINSFRCQACQVVARRSRCSCTSRSTDCQLPTVAHSLSQPFLWTSHFLKYSARRRAVCTVCLFLPATAKVIPVSPVISGHHNLNSVLRYTGLCNSLSCFSHAKNSWLTSTDIIISWRITLLLLSANQFHNTRSRFSCNRNDRLTRQQPGFFEHFFSHPVVQGIVKREDVKH